MSTRIALVEDNTDLREEIVFQLTHLGHPVSEFSHGRAYLDWLREAPGGHVLLLDLGLPDMDGPEIAETVAAMAVDVPLIMLTARDSLNDRVKGWRAGASIYLTKPVALEELQAILERLARSGPPRAGGSAPALELDTLGLRLHNAGGEGVELSYSESRILAALNESQPDPVCRTDLIRHLGGNPEHYDARRLEAIVSRLRKKLAGLGVSGSALKAARGRGYSLTLRLRVVG